MRRARVEPEEKKIDHDLINKITWATMCPYGVWTCRDGTEFLFNRRYRPILWREPGQAAQTAPDGWVKNVATKYLWNVDNSPLVNDETLARYRRGLGQGEWHSQGLRANQRRTGRDQSRFLAGRHSGSSPSGSMLYQLPSENNVHDK